MRLVVRTFARGVRTASCPLLLVAAGVHAAERPARTPIDAAEILRRAEDVRSPDFDYALEVAIRSRSADGRSPERNATFAMVAHGKTHTMFLRRTPPVLSDSVFLIADGRHWALMPRAAKPLELLEGKVIYGEIASGDIARLDFSRSWSAALVGEERFEDDPCYKLELERTGGTGIYTRVLYWIAKSGFLPRRLEYHGTTTQRLVHMARYENYRNTSLGLRPLRMVIEGGNPWEEINVLDFSNLRRIDASPLAFSEEGMLRFRNAATENREPGSGSVITMEAVLGRLAAMPPPSSPREPAALRDK